MKTLTLTLKEETVTRLEEMARRHNYSLETLLEYYAQPETQAHLERVEARKLSLQQLRDELNRPQVYDPTLLQELDNTLNDGLEGR